MKQRHSWEANSAHLIQKFNAFYGTRRFITTLTRARVTFLIKLAFWSEMQYPSGRTTLCRVSGTVYSVHSQLPSTTGGRSLRSQPVGVPCHDDKGPT